MSLCSNQLESVFHLPPPRHRVSAETLTRSLVDYAITFAWLAAPTDRDVRSDRLARFERDEWGKRAQADKRYTTVLPERADRYRDLIARGRMPSGLLNAESRARLEEIQQAGGPLGMPPLIDRAIEADEVWTQEIALLRDQPLANVYASVYATLSLTAHASVSAVDRVVIGAPPKLLVGFPEPIGEAQGPYDIAASLTAVVLIIASLRLGWPPLEEVYGAAVGKAPDGVVDFRRAMRGPHENE